MLRFACLALAVCASTAHADQLHADLGLAVVGGGYEIDLSDNIAVQAEAQAFSTYFLPWFSSGSSLAGYGGQMRVTWFSRLSQHGLYIAPYFRLDSVSDDHMRGVGFCAGGVVGWAFPIGEQLDLRIGAGAQYMHYVLDASKVDTPFVALDLVVGYRL